MLLICLGVDPLDDVEGVVALVSVDEHVVVEDGDTGGPKTGVDCLFVNKL